MGNTEGGSSSQGKHSVSEARAISPQGSIGQASQPQACPGFRGCQGHIAQLSAGVPQPWKEAQAVGLPGPAGLPLKDRGECHSWVNAPSNDLSEISLVCFSVCPPQCICSGSKKTRPLRAHQVS